MTDSDSYWAELNRALDERRDPWADRALASRLESSARRRAELERLQRGLGALVAAETQSATHGRRWLPLAAAIVGLAGLYRFARTPSALREPSPPAAHQARAAQILDLEITLVREHEDQRSTIAFDGQELRRTEELLGRENMQSARLAITTTFKTSH